MRRTLILAAVCGGVACGAGEGGRVIDIEAGEIGHGTMFFRPGYISLTTGEHVIFRITNTGGEAHAFICEDFDTLVTVINPNKTEDVHINAPTQPGTFRCICDLPDHAVKGMVLDVEVSESQTAD